MEGTEEAIANEKHGDREEEEEEENSSSHKTTSYGISIDSSRIRAVPIEEQSSVLRNLGIDVFDHEEFEEGVLKQVDEAITAKEFEADVKRWEKDLKCVDEEIRGTLSEIDQIKRIVKGIETSISSSYESRRRAEAAKRQLENKLKQLKKLEASQKSLHHKLGLGDDGTGKVQEEEEKIDEDTTDEQDKQPTILQDRLQIMKELQKEREQLIQTGELTPFGGRIDKQKEREQLIQTGELTPFGGRIDKQKEREQLIQTGELMPFGGRIDKQKEREQLIQTGELTPFGGRSDKQKEREQLTPFGGSIDKPSTSKLNDDNEHIAFDKDIFTDDTDDNNDADVNQASDQEVDSDEYIPDEEELRDSWHDWLSTRTKSTKSKKSPSYQKQDRANAYYKGEDAIERKPKRAKDYFKNTCVDDGNDKSYRNRMREEKIKKLLKEQASERNPDVESDSEEEMPDMEFDSRLKIPGRIWHKLFLYQQTGVKWLWELHCQQAGGIIGDEMGLGKTIETIAFLAGLKYSAIGSSKKSRNGLGPVLIVCPVTVLHQWVAEFHKWAKEFRVAVLHDTGTYQGHKETLIRKICHDNGVLVTSYSGVRMNLDNLLSKHFDYIILDEGHKIRNPDAEITLACKQFRTPHRIILTGTPMQNNLRELWSLFDFVFPGKLGTLPVFMTEFSVPITTGGYANASTTQVQTAYKCACVLRDTINPYLLRRLKKDVKMKVELPDKNEQVLFCRLSEEQREIYQQYLNSREVQSILAGNYKVFPGLIMLRKICNHPDLTSEAGSLLKAKQDQLKAEAGLPQDPLDEGYGDWQRAGKMIVVEALLKMWNAQGHRVLLFSQSRQMLNIMEKFVISRGYTYRRMDGATSIASRHPMVNKFNTDTSIFVFLLTTRVGGIGINLTGADRIIIYDPDWNPSTDTQARERSWRIGQTKKVTIYRLLTSGTIEEKIYHRQIFKQFLTNRVLKDPKQRRFFKSNDLYELFTLDDSYTKQGTETSAIFAGTNCEIKVKNAKKRRADPRATAQPVKKSRRETKRDRKPKIVRKECLDDGGSFSIDARDRMEVSQANKKDQQERSTASQSDEKIFKTEESPKSSPAEKETNDEATREMLDDDVTPRIPSHDVIPRNPSHDVTPRNPSHDVTPRNPSHDVTPRIPTHDVTPRNPSHDVTPRIPSHDVTPRKASHDVTTMEKTNDDVISNGEANDDVTFRGNSQRDVANHLGVSTASGSNSTVDAKLSSKSLSINDIKEVKSVTLNGEDLHKEPEISNDKKSSHKDGKEKKKKKLKASTLSDREIRRLTRIKKNRRRRQKKGKIEGQEISNLDYHEVHHTESETETSVHGPKENEDAVLTALFNQGGVHSALKHDVIMDSGNPDYSLVESEANRVAQQAVQALKKSRQQCLGARSGVPTWTGVSGLSGHSAAPKPKPRFGKKTNTTQDPPKPSKKGKEPALFSGAFMGMQTNQEDSSPVSSSQLLAKIRARNNILVEETDTSAQVPETEYDSLLAEISQFVTSGGTVKGQATTQEILGRFSSKLPTENNSVFRALLRRICDFKRDSNKEGVWRLRGEFR